MVGTTRDLILNHKRYKTIKITLKNNNNNKITDLSGINSES